ncbi:MAG: UDP-N-acetylmuramoyl-tripeptide--D-alanyl-D-alanine ligase, partial [Micropruina sp.]
MRERTVAEVAALAGARLLEGDRATLAAGPIVTNDSRACRPGSIYVALPGERADGHDFLGAAAEAGAVAALCLQPSTADLAHLLVEDGQAALSRLARGLVAEAKRDGLVCVGITGSSGKTSTKDLIAQVLEASGPTISPPGSFNNEIGVPLTACRVEAETRYLVAEMGARGLGHIAWLCQVVPPDVGVVLNVGHAHAGEFGSLAATALAKGELVEAVVPGGWAVLNAADPLVRAMATRTSARIASFAPTHEPEFGDLRVWAEQPNPDHLQRYSFELRAEGASSGSAPVTLRVPGSFQLSNALAAAAVGLAAGMEIAMVASALSGAEARSRWRMEVTERPDGIVVVNDSYNANPDS